MRFYVYALRDIDKGDEVTIGFDYNHKDGLVLKLMFIRDVKEVYRVDLAPEQVLLLSCPALSKFPQFLANLKTLCHVLFFLVHQQNFNKYESLKYFKQGMEFSVFTWQCACWQNAV